MIVRAARLSFPSIARLPSSTPRKVARCGPVDLDVPAERIPELRPSRELPAKVFVVPPALSALRKPVDWIDEAAVLPFQRRVDAALTPRAAVQSIVFKEDKAMRTAETMEAARRNMADARTVLATVTCPTAPSRII